MPIRRPSNAKQPSREELAPWICTPPLVRAAFWCTFDCDTKSYEVLAERLQGLPSIDWRIEDAQSPPTGKSFLLVGKPPYRRVGWTFKRKSNGWQLEAAFREMGEAWGSNQAEWEKFKATVLPRLGARNVVERTK